MFATYTHDSSTSQANLVNDIVLLLTGTTSAASLSADCVTGSTTITTTYDSAGWTLHDASAGTNTQVVKALQQDGSTYKYVAINATSTSALKLTIYESWNATTHTGTNGVDSCSITWSSTTQHALYIYATQQQIIIGASVSGTFSSPAMALEIDNTPGSFIAGYPTTFTFNTANDLSIGVGPRIKHPNASGDLTTSSTVFMTNTNTDVNNNYQKGRIFRDASENVCMALLSLMVTAGYSQTNFEYGAFGKILGKMRVGSAVLNTAVSLDTVVIGSVTFIAIYIETGNSVVGSSIWVPQG